MASAAYTQLDSANKEPDLLHVEKTTLQGEHIFQ